MAALDQILSDKDEAASDDEATPEQREAHRKAFETAVLALEAETKSICKAGQSIAVLTAVRDEFELWEDGQIDGSMPPWQRLQDSRHSFDMSLLTRRDGRLPLIIGVGFIRFSTATWVVVRQCLISCSRSSARVLPQCVLHSSQVLMRNLFARRSH